MERPKDVVVCLEAVSRLKAGDQFPEWFFRENNWEWGTVLAEVTAQAAKEIRDLRTLQESYSRLCKEVYG